MRYKLRDSRGLTLVEMLCATLILIMLALLIGSGTHMAMDSYKRMVVRSEMELLMSSLSNALADELRYASDINPSSGTLTDYRSWRYGGSTKLSVQPESGERGGMLVADSDAEGEPFLIVASGSYGGETWAGGVAADGLEITYVAADRAFNVKLKVQEMRLNADGKRGYVSGGLELSQEFKVHRLNPDPSPSPSPIPAPTP